MIYYYNIFLLLVDSELSFSVMLAKKLRIKTN